MRFVPLEEEEKQRQAQQPKFVPLEEANKNPQGLKFVPIADMPTEPTPAPAAAPVITSEKNPFAVEGAPTEAPVEKSSLYELPKALVRETINLKGMYAGNLQRQAALGMQVPELALQTLNKIDAGEIKSAKELHGVLGTRKLPSAEEMLTGRETAQVNLRAFDAANDYLKASPEERKAIRTQLQTQLQEQAKSLSEAVELGQETKKQAAPYEARVKSLFDIKDIPDALSYVGSTVGGAFPQVVPMIAAGVLTRGNIVGPAAVGAGMELGAGTQTRVDFIANKIKDEPSPEKRVAQISKYIQDTADVTITAAIINGALDAVLGPEKDIAKALAANTLKDLTRKEIIKAIPKAAASSGAQEFLTGGLQEIVQINAERQLGEQTGDAFTKENIARVVDSAMAEALGGAGVTTAFQASRAALAQKDLSKTDTPEGRAMRGLDAIADEEEKAGKAEFDAATVDGRGTPVARTVENLTDREVTSIQRRLFAELGRPAEESELLEAFNEYVAEQNANLGIESGASVAGVSDTGAEQSTGAAGISDTGAAATSDTGGLGTSGVSTDQLTDRTTAQPSTLDEAVDAFREADEVRTSAYQEFLKIRSAVEDLGYEGSVEDQNELNAMLTAAEARYNEARVAADVAYNTYEQFSNQAIESTESVPSQEDVEAAQPKSEEVLDAEALFEAQRQGDYQDAINAGYDELDQQEQGIQETPVTDVAALEQALDARSSEYQAIKDAQEALLTKAGRIPAKNSPARQKYDELEKQRIEAYWNWTASEKKLMDAKAAQEQDSEEGGGGIFKSLSSGLTTAVSPLVGILPLNKFGINRLNDLFNDGKITAQEYAERMTKLFEDMEDKATKKAMTKGLNRQRGFGTVIKALEDAAKKGRITPETAKFAIWLLTKNPAIANDLAISISMPKSARFKESMLGVAGFYNDTARLVRLITSKDSATGKYSGTDLLVAVHEIMHHMERMLPSELRALIRNEWRVQLQKAMDKADKEGNQNLIKYLALVSLGNTSQSSAALRLAENMIKEGTVDKAFYSLMNPSEFWAVNGSDILFGRYTAKTRFEKLRQYFKEFIEAVKNIFGLDSNNPIIKGLNAVLKGDATFVQKQMLAEGVSGLYPSLGQQKKAAPEEKLEEQFASAGDLRPDVVAAIQNNDLNGALNILASRLGGFYGDLATRLAALNLPTQVRIGEQRSLIRQSIDKFSAPQQVRLFSYIRTKYPQFFAQFFKDYQKAESMEMIYEGLLKLQEFNLEKILGPVLNEYNDVLNAYDDFAPGLVANGGYFVNLDLVNLNNAEGKRNGVNYYVLLHEVVHAATELLLQTPVNQRTPEQNAAIEELNKLYDIAKANIKIEQYGLTSLSEFIAEVYTNQDFRNRLKTIPYAPAKTNVLTRFIQSVMKLVGMDNVAGRAMVEAEKLFNASRSDNTGATGARFAKAKKPRSKGTITGGFRTVESLKERVLASRPEWKDSLDKIRDKIWDPTMAFGRGIKLGAVELRHLSDMAGTKFPLIGGSVRIIEKMISHRGKIMTEAAAIAKDWMALQKKNVAKSKLLGRVMLEATLNGVEVDPLNTKYYDAAKVDQRVKDAWNALGPEFQGIYRRVRDFYQKQMQDAIQIMRDRANQLVDPEQRQKMLDNIDRDFGPDKLIYPYFPLKRFGPYWFQVGPAQKGSNYKEFYTFESMGERNTALRQRKKELLAGNSAQRNLAENHIELGNSVSELLTQMSDTSNILKTVNELIGSLPDKFSDLQLQSQETIEDTILDVQKELRNDINQLLYTLMPEQSMRKQMITRKSVQGASEDMLRVFASSATRIAYQQARAKYSPQYIANLNNARSFIKDMKGVTTPEQRMVYRDFLHEMERRYKPMLGMEDTNTSEKIAGVISDTVTVFMMSAPMSAFLQTIGFFQFTATQLGGRYGYVEATDRMYENFKTYSVSTVDRTLVPLKNGQMLSVHFPSAMESGKLTGLDKIAAQQLMDEEQVNVSQTYDMVSVGDRSSDLTLSKYQAFKRAAFMPLHQIERFNREIGLLTTFQLEYEKITSGPIRDSNGIIVRDAQGNPETYQNDATTPDGVPYSTEAYDRALTYAKDMVAITLGETTRQMRPRFFMNALLALPLKFKRYMITALYSMWSNFDKGFIEPFKTAEIEQMRKVLEANQESPDVIERKIKDMEEFRAELSKEGRKALAGAMFNTFLVGGTVALPFYTTIFPLIIGMFIPDDDDDEFFDFDNWYRNYMEYEFGGFVSGLFVAGGMDPAQAKKLGRGIGEAVVVGPATKLTGGSLSDRVSLDIKSMAFRDMRYTSSARDAMLEGIAMALGPAAGLGLTAAEVKDLWEQKQYGRAFERGLPAILGKPVTATRYALEDAKTKRGDTLVEDITTTEIAMQAIGLAPYRVTKAQKQAIQAVEKVQKIQRKRTDIMNDMWMSHSRGDAEGFEAAYGKSLEFSAKYPTYEITDENIADSFDKRMNEQLIANEVGARVDMKDLPIVLPMLKYGRE